MSVPDWFKWPQLIAGHFTLCVWKIQSSHKNLPCKKPFCGNIWGTGPQTTNEPWFCCVWPPGDLELPIQSLRALLVEPTPAKSFGAKLAIPERKEQISVFILVLSNIQFFRLVKQSASQNLNKQSNHQINQWPKTNTIYPVWSSDSCLRSQSVECANSGWFSKERIQDFVFRPQVWELYRSLPHKRTRCNLSPKQPLCGHFFYSFLADSDLVLTKFNSVALTSSLSQTLCSSGQRGS